MFECSQKKLNRPFKSYFELPILNLILAFNNISNISKNTRRKKRKTQLFKSKINLSKSCQLFKKDSQKQTTFIVQQKE